MAELQEVREVKERHKEEILSRPNVVGVGAGYKKTGTVTTDQIVVVALVKEKLPLSALAEHEVIPANVDGVITDVIEVGELRALQDRTDRWRPAPPGVSLGHYRITAGTFGCVVRDRDTGERLILSNNHVLANENDAEVGDAILQPGPADGGLLPQDTLATLLRFIPLHYEGEPESNSCLPLRWVADAAEFVGWNSLADSITGNAVAASNLVDAALARPVDEIFTSDILEIGPVTASMPAALGMGVRKSGRTTGLSSGQIQVVDSTVRINYSGGRVARFENQILTSNMSQGGDSGSLLVAENEPLAVGLLFGGSDVVTIHSPIDVVLDLLAVEL
jgi:hypothetical protein